MNNESGTLLKEMVVTLFWGSIPTFPEGTKRMYEELQSGQLVSRFEPTTSRIQARNVTAWAKFLGEAVSLSNIRINPYVIYDVPDRQTLPCSRR
jgi:hypothetical protein